jgi:F-type H+-transporting ATPase subunit b
MPQLDPTHFLSQLFWLALTFFVLYAVVSLIITPKMENIFERRNRRLSTDRNAANDILKDVSAIQDRCQKHLTQAEQTAKNLIEETGKKLDQDLEVHEQKLHKQAQDDLEIAQNALNEEHEKALSHMVSAIDELEIAAMKHFIREKA